MASLTLHLVRDTSLLLIESYNDCHRDSYQSEKNERKNERCHAIKFAWSSKARRPSLAANPFGNIGPYERLLGMVSFAIDPNEKDLPFVCDLEFAPRNVERSGRIQSGDRYGQAGRHEKRQPQACCSIFPIAAAAALSRG